jgi:hypothetical protein
MSLVEQSIAWAKGEQFEGLCIAIFGLVFVVLAGLLWKIGTTNNAQSLVLPTFVFGLLFSAMGCYMFYSNGQRQEAFLKNYETDRNGFVAAEKKRVEDFQFMYPASLAISAICFLVTLIAFVWSDNSNFQSIGILLSVFGLSLIVIDFFSKERALIYYEQILNNLP